MDVASVGTGKWDIVGDCAVYELRLSGRRAVRVSSEIFNL